MITGPAIRHDVELALGILDEAVTALGNRDIKGKHPGDKDYERMDDIAEKSNGDPKKALALAAKMAQAIGRGGGSGSREKAHRRARAAMDVFPGELGKRMADMFMDAANVKFLSRSTESNNRRQSMGRQSFDGPSMRRELQSFSSALSENIDNISREQCQDEGEEFLRIVGLAESPARNHGISEQRLQEDEFAHLWEAAIKSLDALRKSAAGDEDGKIFLYLREACMALRDGQKNGVLQASRYLKGAAEAASNLAKMMG